MAASTNGKTNAFSESVYESVKDYYGKKLSKSSDLQTSACTTATKPSREIRDALAKVPKEISDKYYGCGTPLPSGIEGLSVLDLGSGSGRDCYAAAALTGPKGFVTGIDMTEEQLKVARHHVNDYMKVLGYPTANMKFVQGYMECLEEAGIQANSVDLVISNCVINLSPNKERVLSEVYKALKVGGEFYFSDVYCSRRLPESLRAHDVGILYGECLGGALYIEDFKRICMNVGFVDVRQLSLTPFDVYNPQLKELLGEAKFYSITYRCFKLPESLEPLGCEDYGQIAVYNGGIPGNKSSYRFDKEHRFETNLPVRVCGNTAAMLQESWLGKYFTITGNRHTHYGSFKCSGVISCTEPNDVGLVDSSCCA